MLVRPGAEIDTAGILARCSLWSEGARPETTCRLDGRCACNNGDGTGSTTGVFRERNFLTRLPFNSQENEGIWPSGLSSWHS